LTAGHNRIGKIFISSNRAGSQVEAVARDLAIAVSIALQFGTDLQTIRAALTRDHDRSAATLLGAAWIYFGEWALWSGGIPWRNCQ
jgi:hypothetical protein